MSEIPVIGGPDDSGPDFVPSAFVCRHNEAAVVMQLRQFNVDARELRAVVEDANASYPWHNGDKHFLLEIEPVEDGPSSWYLVRQNGEILPCQSPFAGGIS